jgi:hypothetical protein
MLTPEENKKPTIEQILKALLPGDVPPDPLGELITTGQAVFTFIRQSKMKPSLKEAFYELEKKFVFYATILRAIDE